MQIVLDGDNEMSNLFSGKNMKKYLKGDLLIFYPEYASNEYPQHMFSLRNKKTINLIAYLLGFF